MFNVNEKLGDRSGDIDKLHFVFKKNKGTETRLLLIILMEKVCYNISVKLCTQTTNPPNDLDK